MIRLKDCLAFVTSRRSLFIFWWFSDTGLTFWSGFYGISRALFCPLSLGFLNNRSSRMNYFVMLWVFEIKILRSRCLFLHLTFLNHHCLNSIVVLSFIRTCSFIPNKFSFLFNFLMSGATRLFIASIIVSNRVYGRLLELKFVNRAKLLINQILLLLQMVLAIVQLYGLDSLREKLWAFRHSTFDSLGRSRHFGLKNLSFWDGHTRCVLL